MLMYLIHTYFKDHRRLQRSLKTIHTISCFLINNYTYQHSPNKHFELGRTLEIILSCLLTFFRQHHSMIFYLKITVTCNAHFLSPLKISVSSCMLFVLIYFVRGNCTLNVLSKSFTFIPLNPPFSMI